MSGVISSINTNSSAMVALNSLNTIQSELQTTQTAISTGYRVSSAVQDGAAYAVAQTVRSNVSGLTTANQQLGGVQGLLGVATTGLNSAQDMMKSMRQTLTSLSDGTVTGNQRSQYVAQYQAQLQNVQTYLQNSNYNGRNIIGGTMAGTVGTYTTTALKVANNDAGGTFNVNSFNGGALFKSLNFTTTQLNGASTVAGLLNATGTFTNQFNSVGTALNTLGNETNLVSNQVTFNTNKMNALNNGIGALVDTNMAAESAKLQSLQIQQQLATSALSIANQAPSLLTKLIQ